MAEAVVSVALETLRDVLLEEGRLLVGVGTEVKALQTQLKEIKCFLKDADAKQHKSESIRNWLAEIRDLAYRAEDVILEYAVGISSDRRPRGVKRVLHFFSRSLRGCYSLHQLGSEISDIKSELARIAAGMEAYGIIESGGSWGGSIQNWTRKTFPSEIEDCFVGKEDDLKRLVSLLLDDDQTHRVISIWGMGGIGKTTVAKEVYNRMIESEIERFNSFAWVCITPQCQIRSVLEDVLKQLDPQKGEGVSSLSDTQLVEKLCEIQRGKRCLIVLDDLWETSHWDGLKHAFIVRNLKSKILLTTRKQKVAEIGFSLELALMNLEDGWELLKKKAFPGSNIPEFVFQAKTLTIGKEMVRKCGCLPLAISLLGGVLSRKSCLREWELVNANINASIYRGEGYDKKDHQIDGVLNLSYEDLPYCLKPCFLYLGRLKEDESIYAPDLYRMWIAQGMISDENVKGNKETLTETAELYLSELASRSIIQVEMEDVIPKQKYKTCKLHDVVRELCLSMGKKEDFGVQILDYQGGKFSTLVQETLSRSKTRHLIIHLKTELELEHDEVGITCAKDTSKHVRSLEIVSDIKRKAIEFPPQSIFDFRKFKLLRGLVLLRFKFVDRKLPKGITDLIHLRYLRLRECELDSLPPSLSNLAYLDTLDLYNSWNVRVPDVLKKMPRLKNLLLPFYDKKVIGNYRLKLDGVDQLESLIVFDSSVHELKYSTKMKNLRRLSASICDNESLSAIINAIATNWNKLSYCTVSIKQGCKLTSEEGLMKLKQAFSCPNLYYLRICVRLEKLLEDCTSDIISSKLVKLSMLECEIVDDPMGILGKLPSLKELYLGRISFVGTEMTCHEFSFPCLQKVELNGLPNWREWRVEHGAMPLVSEISIIGCPCLEKVPDGFSSISSLKKLVILGMPRLRKRVMGSGQEGVDFHKVSHVSSIIINKSPLRFCPSMRRLRT